ncbi:MAG: DEAD/DEAH box helicase [Nitrosopumilus sp.]
MKFCPQCNSRLISNECHNWKCTEGKVTEKRRPNSSWNYLYAKTKPCYNGCGGMIYFDEDYKSENDKFIPLDAVTREPHQCQQNILSSDDPDYSFTPQTSQTQKTTLSYQNSNSNGDTTAEILSHVNDIKYFDVTKISKKDLFKNPIIEEIVEGHNEENLSIIHYEHSVSTEPEKIPLESLKDIILPEILDGIAKNGLKNGFLKYQVNSIKSILAGKNVMISAPTGSGKTEAFAIPIIQKILTGYALGVYALLTYPLNALIDDQISKINKIIERCGLEDKIVARAIHRGISQAARQNIIKETSQKCVILATSFDFIDWHLTMQTNNWKALCQPAKILVMDESHSYTSFHGSNVYHVIKRMKKYMGNIQCVCSSATLDNSQQFFSEMFDLDENSFESIKSNEGRKQDIYKLFVMPRKMPQRETMEMLSSICHKNRSKQLVFSNTVNNAEILATNLRERNPGMRVRVHSGVIEKGDRRIAEGEMRQGDLDVLSCTPTLELGMDIGQINVVVSAFTGEFDKFVQRIGRAGRRGQKSYVMCVFEPRDAICHYYANNISEYLQQDHTVQINKDNPIISEKHAKSKEIELVSSQTFDKKPLWDYANNMNLRGTSGSVKIIIPGKNSVEKNIPIGYYQLHQKALYQLNSILYEVEKFEKTKDGGKSYLEECRIIDKNKRTLPLVHTQLSKTQKKLERKIVLSENNSEISLVYGIINLNKTITGYYKGNKNDNIQVLKKIRGTSHPNWKDLVWDSKHSAIEIHLPLQPSKSNNDDSSSDTLTHTLTHVFVNAAKIVTKSDSGDIDAYFDDNDDALYLYDNTANGANGCSKVIYDKFEDVLDKVQSLLSNCDCKNGCPKCIHVSEFCHTNNQDLGKQKALEFFKKCSKDND